MKLKDYIDQGYTVLTFGRLSQKIKEKYPNALTHDQDFIGSDKLLIDEAAKGFFGFQEIINGASDISFRKFTRDFCGDLPREMYSDMEHKKRKLQTLSIEAPRVDLICDVLLLLIEDYTKHFKNGKDICYQEKVHTVTVGSKMVVFSFWSYDEDLKNIEKTITNVYDVKIVG
ncbi:hypothetical protein [Enterococcus casseliflavus]|uniref:hypothetical protein n=1 Tax=Enterococcus casseliflavus TaxID=37734 RepID=UPI001CAA1E33|nr:hypothetical protein [Enterococcus casseliflavus]MBZ0323541.1 hypothetical protein [Enterococcus casseliflavus]